MTHTTRLDIIDAGWMSTFQDAGRTGSEHLGVPVGGSADQHSAAVANILVGNARSSTLLEMMGEFSAVPDRNILIAATGGIGTVLIGDYTADSWAPVVVPAGVELRLLPRAGTARMYLAVAGTFTADTFLGSAAPDARMGFTQQIRHGDSIALTTVFTGFRQPFFDHALFRLPVPIWHPADGDWTVPMLPGPHSTIPGIRELIRGSSYRVTDQSNHVGIRLDGPVLHPADDTEIISHGVPVGAVEIPHGDELIVLGRYRTVTAGYPIVGFIPDTAQSALGQASPGRTIRFAWTTAQEAQEERWRAEGALSMLEHAVHDVFSSVRIPLHRTLADQHTP